MKDSMALEIFVWWLILANVWSFALFGLDKWRAKRDQARRISESTLLLVSALGGWPGGLFGIVVFRHKSAKPSFLLQFFGASIVGVALFAGALKLCGH